MDINDDSPRLKVQIATGRSEETKGQATIDFTICKIPGIVFSETFYILAGDLEVILLGEPFLISEEAKIDYRETTLRIAGRFLYLDRDGNEFNQTPDAMLMSKALHLAKQTTLASEEKEVLRNFSEKKQNWEQFQITR